MSRKPQPARPLSVRDQRINWILGGLVCGGTFIWLGIATFSYGSPNGWFGVTVGAFWLWIAWRGFAQTLPPRSPRPRPTPPNPTHQVPRQRSTIRFFVRR